MNTVTDILKEIEITKDNIQRYHEIIRDSYSQTSKLEIKLASLESEMRRARDEYFRLNFNIPGEDAAKKGYYIVFDKNGKFIKSVICGPYSNADFSRVSGSDVMDLLTWLKENKLYAQSASSFCQRNDSWYCLTLREQLESLTWEFDEYGTLIKTEWQIELLNSL